MISQKRLRKFIEENQHGQCKILSLGDECECPLCDFDRITGSLKWYGEEAEALSKNIKSPDSILASVAVLSLDAGKKSKV